MVNIIPYVKIIRPINLLVIFLTQGFLYFLILIPHYDHHATVPLLNFNLFVQITICTMLLAAGSFIVNDIFDIDIDKINKSDKIIIENWITIKRAWKYYITTIFLGLFIALNIAIQTNRISLLWIYPISIWFLYLYAKRWKKQFLIGNLIVSIFSSFVAGILLLAEWESLLILRATNKTVYQSILLLFIFYMIFAFLTSLYREIIKDIEDIEGDQKHQSKTIPIVLGIQKTKQILYFLASLLLLSLAGWIWTQSNYYSTWKHLILIIGVIFPFSYLQIALYKSVHKASFHRISFYTKIIMLIGIVYLFLL